MTDFAVEMMREEKPVLISFLPQFDSLSIGLNLSDRIALGEKYRQAWRYIFEYFRKSGVTNIVSVYHANEAQNVDRFFPGLAYVDWLKTDLSASLRGENDLYQDFQKLYITEAFSLKRTRNHKSPYPSKKVPLK